MQGGTATGSSPFMMVMHWPLELQRRQGAVQELSQQTPSAQLPEAQSRPVRQLAPRAFWVTQVPPLPVQVPPEPQLALTQHRPSTQLPLVHWLPSVQVDPEDRRATQVPSWQKFPLEQSAFPAQAVAQEEPLQTKRPQLRVEPGMQTPLPSQVAMPVSVPPLQVREPQDAPAPCSWQPPLPSQRPVRPQLSGGCMAQPVFLGAELAAKFRQEPAAPGRLQERQGPAHSETSQQAPSTQLPE